MSAVLTIHLIATVFMTGLIWFVQVVHYPLMRFVGLEQFPLYEQKHREFTTWVVMPVMLIELTTGVILVIQAPGWREVAGLTLIGLIWVTTWLCSVPAHIRLSIGFDLQAHQFLVRTNWIRTLGWTARSVIGTMFCCL